MIRPAWIAAGVVVVWLLVATVIVSALHDEHGPADAYRAAVTSSTEPAASVVTEPTTVTTTPAPTTSSTSTTEAAGAAIPPDPAPAVTVAPLAEVAEGGTASVSWYGAESGSHTANGEAYDPDGLTFAHRSMPFGTSVRFCGPLGCVVARCADRGPFIAGRAFDLSRAAFASVAPLGSGVATVRWAVVG